MEIQQRRKSRNSIFVPKDAENFYKSDEHLRALEIHSKGKRGDMLGKYRQDVAKDYRDELNRIEREEEKKVQVFVIQGREVEYAKTNCLLLDNKNPIRKGLVWLIENQYFNLLIILVILLNSIAIASFDYKDRKGETNWNKIIERVNNSLTIIFIAEFLIKVLAMGFVYGKNAYLKDLWNFLDFVIVISGIIEFCNGSQSLKALRLLRIIRPLKSLKILPGMKDLVTALLRSLPYLGNVLIFLTFLYIFFSIVGLQFFSGSFYSLCRTQEKPVNATYWPTIDDSRVCNVQGNFGSYKCPQGTFCGHPQDHGTDLQYEKIFNNKKLMYGIVIFDTFLDAFLSVFQIISMDNWSGIMYNLIDSSGVMGALYCMLVVIICSFFVMNMLLAVIMQAFIQIQKHEVLQKHQKKKETKKKEIQALNEQLQKLQDPNDTNRTLINKPAALNIPFDLKSTPAVAADQGTSERNGRQAFKELAKVLRDAVKKSVEQEIQAEFEREKNKGMFDEIQDGFFKTVNFIIQPEDENEQDSEQLLVEEVKEEELIQMDSEQEKEQQVKRESITNIQKQLIELEQLPQDKKLEMEEKIIEESNKELQKLDSDKQQRYIERKDQFTRDLLMKGMFRKIIKQTINGKMMTDINMKVKQNDQDKELSIAEFTKEMAFLIRKPENETLEQEMRRLALLDRLALTLSKEIKSREMMQKLKQDLVQRMVTSCKNETEITELNEKALKQFNEDRLSIRSEISVVHSFCVYLVLSKTYGRIITICILLSTFLLASNYDGITSDVLEVLENMNLLFCIIFTVEILISLVAYGVRDYFREAFNLFDTAIMIVSLVDITISYTGYYKKDETGALTVLRSFRLLRVLKLSKVWQNFQNILNTMIKTLKDIRNFSVLLFLFIFTYAILGMEVFAHTAKYNLKNQIDPEGFSPVFNFDDFSSAVTSVFIILANDNWIQIYYDYYRYRTTISTTWYFCSLLVFGQYIMLNLFLAILVQNFEEDSEVNEFKKQMNQKTQINLSQKIYERSCICLRNRSSKTKYEVAELDSTVIVEERKQEDPSPLRLFCQKIVESKYFQGGILFFIGLSSIALAVESPLLDPEGMTQKVLFIAEIIFTIIFAIEAVLKIVAKGFLLNENSYLSKLENKVDFFIMIGTVLSLILNDLDVSFFRIIRLFRILSPLRVISRNPGLKISIQSLMNAIPDIISVFVVTAIIFMVFCILGINFLKGKFYLCECIEDNSRCLYNKWNCYNQGGAWKNYPSNFDDIIASLSVVFQMSSISGWTEVMRIAENSTQKDEAPVLENNQWIRIPFIFFIIFGSFFLLKLFVGVIISKFNREKERCGSNFLLSDKQKAWVDMKLVIVSFTPIPLNIPPSNEFRAFFWRISEHVLFEIFIIASIIGNTVALALTWYDEPENIGSILSNMNLFFAIIFILEAIIKLIAYKQRYFYDRWNAFDMLIVIGTTIAILVDAFTGFDMKKNAMVIRIFRIARILKVVKRAKMLGVIFQTFFRTLPALLNIGALLMLFLFIYAILGVFLFATIKTEQPEKTHANFSHLSIAIMALVRVTTSDNWHEIQWSLEKKKSVDFFCIENPSYEDYLRHGKTPIGCGSSKFISELYFLTFHLVVTFMFLNLFIAIILQGFEDTYNLTTKQIDKAFMKRFQQLWSVYDPEASSFIKMEILSDLLLALDAPYGMRREIYTGNLEGQAEFIAKLNMPLFNDNQHYQFNDVIEALLLNYQVKMDIKKIIEKQETEVLEQGIEEKIKEKLKTGMLEKTEVGQRVKMIKEQRLNKLAMNFKAIVDRKGQEEREKKEKNEEFKSRVNEQLKMLIFKKSKIQVIDVVAQKKLPRKSEMHNLFLNPFEGLEQLRQMETQREANNQTHELTISFHSDLSKESHGDKDQSGQQGVQIPSPHEEATKCMPEESPRNETIQDWEKELAKTPNHMRMPSNQNNKAQIQDQELNESGRISDFEEQVNEIK